MKDQSLPKDAEAAAIRAVIIEETDAFFAKDFDRWAACFLHAPRTHLVRMMSISPRGGVWWLTADGRRLPRQCKG